MANKAKLFTSFLGLTFLSNFNCKEVANVSEQVSNVLKAYVKESSNFVDMKIADLMATMNEEFGGKLDKIMESVGYLERREKMVELCPRGRCGVNRKCVLSEDLQRSECPCVDRLGGKNCELRGACFIERYRYSQIPSGPEFPYNCSDDGYYYALQFNESGGYCVTDLNEVISDYRREGVDGITAGTCECARYKFRTQGKPFDRSTCKPNGDFAEISCSYEFCWCQDLFGSRVSETFNIDQIDQFRPRCKSTYYNH